MCKRGYRGSKCKMEVRGDTICAIEVRRNSTCKWELRGDTKCAREVRGDIECVREVRGDTKCAGVVRRDTKCAGVVRGNTKYDVLGDLKCGAMRKCSLFALFYLDRKLAFTARAATTNWLGSCGTSPGETWGLGQMTP